MEGVENESRMDSRIRATFVRCQIGDTRSTFEFCYRDIGGDQQHFRTICCISDFRAEPQFSGYVETLGANAAAESHNNSVYQKHYCRWDELLAIRRLWASQLVTFDDWLAEVLSLSILAEEEKERLQRAYPATVG